MRRLTPFLTLILVLIARPATAQRGPGSSGVADDFPGILPLRERPAVVDAWLTARLETVLPAVMRREGFDMWIVDNREYNEDPVFFSLMPGTTMAARRRTILVFYDPGPGQPLERMAVSRYGIGEFYEGMWDPESEPDQYRALAKVVAERDPRRIGIDTSTVSAFGDGLSATSLEQMKAALGPKYAARLTGAERVAIGWLETRIPGEMAAYDDIAGITHRLIAKAFSREVVHPGLTTTEDVVWWFRQAYADLDLETWFQPSIEIIRQEGAPSSPLGEDVIMPGDVLHCDVGIVYLGRCTDVQQMAYVLRPGEEEAPAGVQAALRNANRVQDLFLAAFRTARTGNEILSDALSRCRAEGLECSIYTHPIGFHGHAAGPTIGMWDMQGGVPGAGDYPLFPNTLYSIELNATTAVPEWGGQRITIGLEQEGYFDGTRVRFLDRRQTAYLLIR